MRFRKLRSGWFLLSCYVTGSVRGVVRQLSRGPYAAGYELVRCAVRTARATRLLWLTLRGRTNAEALVRLCQKVQIDPRRLYRNPDAAFFLVKPLMARQRYEKVIEIMTALAEPEPERAKCYGVRGLARLQLGQYPEALADLTRCHELWPQVSMGLEFNHNRAFLHGLRGDVKSARVAMRDQLGLPDSERPDRVLARFLHQRLQHLFANLGLRGSVGVFFGSYPNAVGHAILDPFHYINLFRHRFDNLVMVHPDLTGYTTATRLTMSILEQYVETVPCADREILYFTWQHLGELRHENFTFLLYNYWALNRLAFKARQDPAHPLHHGRAYLQPSPKIVARAEALCRRNNIAPTEPLVVVHSREHSYHELHGQSYRNMDVRNYVPALRKLVSLGYQVVRIGDRKMTSLRRDVPGLVELPMTDFYSPVLDPYFIARCAFMISCQSGPCSYARVFGKPNLVINAVYHYTLLPERNELIAFKDYRDARTKQSLSVEQIFRAGTHLFDRTRHFVEKGIEVVDMTPEEIEASVEEMLQWQRDPNRPETPAQQEFRRLMNHFGSGNQPDSPLATPMTDYIGYALPECRISDAVAALRPGYLPVRPRTEAA